MTLPQDKPHITAGEIFKIKRKYDIFSYISNIPGISSETLEILKKAKISRIMSLKIFLRYQLTNQIHRVSGILYRAPAIFCLSQNFLGIACRKAPKALKTLKALKFL